TSRGGRVKYRAFKKNGSSFSGNATFKPSENPCNAQRFTIAITDHDIPCIQFSFNTIQRSERRLFRKSLYNYFTSYFIRIKSMERLAGFLENEIGNIYNIIHRFQTKTFQFIL